MSWDRAQEFRILQAAHRAGVTVPEPLGRCASDPAVLGKRFYLMRRVPGEARGHRLVRDPAVLAAGEALAARLGAELAKLHRLGPPVAGLEFIPVPDRAPALARVAEYRRHLDALGARRAGAGVGAGTGWSARSPATSDCAWSMPTSAPATIWSPDGELTAVLDWEFAGFSDPHEDLGWMLARYWRFGAYEREAGGIGSRAAFLDGYEAAAGAARSTARAVPYWEVMATVRWAVIALMQAARHYSGARALAGAGAYRPRPPGARARPADHDRAGRHGGAGSMSQSSMAANLLATARNLLRSEIAPALPGNLRFPAAMIANAMAIASRELEHGADNRAQLRALLARRYPERPETAPLDDLQRSFARDLRAGRFDHEEHAGLRALLRSYIQLHLKISAPHLAEKAGTTP